MQAHTELEFASQSYGFWESASESDQPSSRLLCPTTGRELFDREYLIFSLLISKFTEESLLITVGELSRVYGALYPLVAAGSVCVRAYVKNSLSRA